MYITGFTDKLQLHVEDKWQQIVLWSHFMNVSKTEKKIKVLDS